MGEKDSNDMKMENALGNEVLKGDTVAVDKVEMKSDGGVEGKVDVRKDEETSEGVKSLNSVESDLKLENERKQDNMIQVGKDVKKEDQVELLKEKVVERGEVAQKEEQVKLLEEKVVKDGEVDQKKDQGDHSDMKSLNVSKDCSELKNDDGKDGLGNKMKEEPNQTVGEIVCEEKETDPVFDGSEVPGLEANVSPSTHSLDPEINTQGNVWSEKAVAIKNLVKEKSSVAVSTVLRGLSMKKDKEEVPDSDDNKPADTPKESKTKDESQKTEEKSTWNPLSYIMPSREVYGENKAEQKKEGIENLVQPITMKGRIILYTKLQCRDSKEARLFLLRRKLKYVEINIDVYPGRKMELEKITGSSDVPRVFFNEVLIGGLKELKSLEESGKLAEKIDHLISEEPSSEAPLPPVSGEDDVSSIGATDELALIVQKMKETVVIKDRFYKLRRFTSCFIGSEAVDFLSENQHLERQEALEFGRNLASKLFFRHVLDENVFEDSNHLYRFLDDDPIVSSQCHNIPKGISLMQPMPIKEIATKLRFLSSAIFESYTSEDGKHVDYTSIHESEEFARYLRMIEGLQRVDLQDMPREEKLAFFINLYNMMAIHAILLVGYPSGALERRKLYGDFKYVVGGCTYSLSAIRNGILRGNQRPPYNLMRPFRAKDRRCGVALPSVEPLVHFALVCGHRSGPPLRCYSPGEIDKELADASRNFFKSGGLTVDFIGKVASVSSLLKWFSVDFGKNEIEVLKYLSKYMEPAESEALLELLGNTQFKVIYQPYDWSVNR